MDNLYPYYSFIFAQYLLTVKENGQKNIETQLI